MSTLEVMGKRIQQRRKELRITQIGLAKALGLSEDSRSSISRWEKGTEFPSTALIPKLCDILHCDVGYLFGEYELPTRELTDISRETGLSVEAVKAILDIRDSRPFQSRIDILSWLLSEETFSFDLLLCLQELKTAQAAASTQEKMDVTIFSKGKMLEYGRKYREAETDIKVMRFEADTKFRRILDDFCESICNPERKQNGIGWEVIEDGID